jgi:endoglucanase
MQRKRSLRAIVGALCLPGLALAGAGVVAAGGAGAGTVDPVTRTPLSTSGGRIVDRDGAEFVIQGVNWFGFETGNHVVHGLWTRDYKEMLAQIRSLGFNAIRLPFSLQALQSTTVSGVDFSNGRNAALAGKTPIEAMDVIIQEAAAQGLLILLDNHSLNDDSHTYDLWYGSGGHTEDSWVASWEMLAQRYRNQANVIGADLKNEPHGRATWGDGAPTDWRRAAERAGNAVLAKAPHWLIVVEGVEGPVPGQQLPSHWWGGNLEGVGQHPVRLTVPNRVVYSPHEYGPGVYDQPWFSRPDWQNVLYDRWTKGFQYIADRGIAPILVGEFGGRQTGTDTVEGIWQRQFMDFLAQKGSSWTYWSWNPNSGDTGGVLQADWRTVDAAKMDLLTLLIDRRPVPFPPAGGSTTTTTTTTTTSTSTTTTTAPTTTTTTTVPPPTGGLTGGYVIDSQWGSGYCASLVANNATSTTATGVSFKFTLPSADRITTSWNGTFSRRGTAVYVALPAWAQNLAPGGRYAQTGFCVEGPDRPSGVQVFSSGPASPPPPTPPPPGSGLSAKAVVESQWDTGHCAAIEISNPGTTTRDPNGLAFTLPGPVGLTQSWNGTVVRTVTDVAVALPDWVGPLAPGASSRDFGFCTDAPVGAATLPTGITVS